MYVRDCSTCKKYYFSKGQILKDSKGKPLERNDKTLPNCRLCQKHDNSDGSIWNGFTTKNEYYFKTFLVAHYFGVLPRVGGIDQQSPIIVEILIVLKEMFIRHKEVNDMEFQMKLMSGVGIK